LGSPLFFWFFPNQFSEMGESPPGIIFAKDLAHYLHESQIYAWEREICAALENADGRSGREAVQRDRIKELERELHRKDKALAEMSALIVLKKKLARILGEEEPLT
jgi:RNase P protein component